MNSNHQAQDFDAFSGAGSDLSSSRNFQNWDNDPNFNLFDFIGEEEHDQDNSNTLANQEDPKDKLWKNYQYNQLALGGTGTYDDFESTYNNMRNPMLSSSSHQQTNTSYDNGYYQDYATSSTSGYPSSSTANFPIKTEVQYADDDMSYSDANGIDEFPPAGQSPVSQITSNGLELALRSSLRTPKPNSRFLQDSYVDPAIIEQRVNQATKKPPRKYRVKPDTEKVNPVYKQKREKNNDAVRRSREKAKALQAEKDSRLTNMERRCADLLQVIEYYRQNCTCGIKHPKIPNMFN